MDRLILFRHGKAEASAPSGDDFDRRLAPRGQQEAAEMAGRLRDLGFAPDLVLVSTAARTRDTWAAAATVFGDGPQVRFEDDLYHADTATLRRIIEREGAAHPTILVVGHNPGLHELTLRLMLEADAPQSLFGRAQRQFPTAAMSVFEKTGDGLRAVDLLLPERWS